MECYTRQSFYSYKNTSTKVYKLETDFSDYADGKPQTI